MTQLPTGSACEREPMLRRTKAAEYIQSNYGIPCSPKTLAKLACVSSDGPPFRKVGRTPLYARADLDAWARSKIGPLVRSTSDYAASSPTKSSWQRESSLLTSVGGTNSSDIGEVVS